MTAPAPAIEATGLVKTHVSGWFGSTWATPRRRALDGVDLRVEAGRGLAVIGPNGAGKSSLLLALAGLRRPDAGQVRIEGRDVRDPEARRSLGLLPERPALYGGRSVVGVLRLYAGVQGLAAPEAAIARELGRLDLGAWADTDVDALPEGARQRVALAQALLHRPTVLLLDEPLTHLDPASARRMVQVLAEERARGVTLVATTHDLADLAEVCDEVALLRDGRLTPLGGTAALLSSLPCRVLFTLPAGAAVPFDAHAAGDLRVAVVADREAAVRSIVGAGGSVVRVEPDTEGLR